MSACPETVDMAVADDASWSLIDAASDRMLSRMTATDIREATPEVFTELMCDICSCPAMVFDGARSCYMCLDCGYTSESVLNDGPEWNMYDDERGEGSRCTMIYNAFLPNMSMATTIVSKTFSKIGMMHRWGQIPYRERSLAEVINFIDYHCRNTKLTRAVVDNARILYIKLRDYRHADGKAVIFRGAKRKHIIAACVYFGAKMQDAPVSPKRVADIFNMDVHSVTKGCREFLEYMKDRIILLRIKDAHAHDYIQPFAARLGFDDSVMLCAKSVFRNTNALDVATNHKPPSIAAASVLMACRRHDISPDKKRIASLFEISDVTLMKTFKEIEHHAMILCDESRTLAVLTKIEAHLLEGFEARAEAPADDSDVVRVHRADGVRADVRVRGKKKRDA